MSDPLTSIFELIRSLVGQPSTGAVIPFFDPLYNLTVLVWMGAIAAIIVSPFSKRFRGFAAFLTWIALIPDFCWKRVILARGTTLSPFNALQHLLICGLPDPLCNSLSLDIWPTTGQKENRANSFGEQVTSRILHLLAKSVFAFVFEVGALVLGYYAYLAWTGVSVTGSLFSDILLPVSLVMMFGLNVAVVFQMARKGS